MVFRGNFVLGKVLGTFVEEMIYDIQARVSVRLSEVGRSLMEKTSLKKRIDRLSRNLGRSGLADDISEVVLAEGAAHIKQDTLLIVDPTDITKKYAKKMECLAQVRDGSEKQYGLGYWVDSVVGADTNSSEIIPLVHRLYSQVADEFVSENSDLLDAMRTLYDAAKGRNFCP
jgi:hypothetical protein